MSVSSLAWNRQRAYATLVGLGICVLLSKTIVMLTDGSLTTLMTWTSALLAVESLLDAGTLLGAVWWWTGGTGTRAWLPLRLAAAAVIVHAVRVLVYVLGRTGPWHNFDVRPAHRAAQTPEWHWLVFAAVLSVLGVVGVVIVWVLRRRRGRLSDST
jgi:hypothetical protein